jgi:5-methylcytosine-specific restriction protein A
MPHHPLKPCRQPGCPALVSSGYCPEHQPAVDTRQRFKKLDQRVKPEQRRFYQSAQWTELSKAHRMREPLCRRCKAAGFIVPVALVHHNPDFNTLVAQGLNPLDEKYLESICLPCHQKELSKKNNMGRGRQNLPGFSV